MRIAIFTLGSRGDVQPYLALAKYAVLNGNSAVICTGKSFEHLVKENCIEFVPVESDLMALLQTDEGKEIMNNAGILDFINKGNAPIVISAFLGKSFISDGLCFKTLYEKTLSVQDLIDRFQDMENNNIIQSAQVIKDKINKEKGEANALEYIEKICKGWSN